MKWWKNWKSKKTLRTRAVTYEALWLAAEADVGAYTREIIDLKAKLLQVEHPRTVVLTPSLQRAHSAIERLGIPPRGRNTIIVTSPQTLEGLRLETGDRVVMIDGWATIPGVYAIWDRMLTSLDHPPLSALWISYAD